MQTVVPSPTWETDRDPTTPTARRPDRLGDVRHTVDEGRRARVVVQRESDAPLGPDRERAHVRLARFAATTCLAHRTGIDQKRE